MYVCLCNALTDRDVHPHMAGGGLLGRDGLPRLRLPAAMRQMRPLCPPDAAPGRRGRRDRTPARIDRFSPGR